jgi:hypothetical protein
LSLSACLKPTPYKAAADDSSYGYKDERLEENRYRITFSGNHLTNRNTVENYMLYRAAELTVAQGFDYFQIVTKETETQTEYGYPDYGPSVFVFGGRRHGAIGWGYGSRYYYGPSNPQQWFTVVANVVMRDGEKPADDTTAYDARAVLNNLSGKIVRPEPETE